MERLDDFEVLVASFFVEHCIVYTAMSRRRRHGHAAAAE